MMPSRRGFSGSPYFRLEQVAEGVYAAIAIPGAGAWGNAGIIDLGGRTLVFDTFACPQAARDLRTATELLTGRPAAYVVSSHGHADHVLGNQVFTEAVVLATTITREYMLTETPSFLDHLREHPEYISNLADRVEREPDEARRRELAHELGNLRQITAALPSLSLRLPEITFDHRLCLHGANRTVEVLSYGGGHSPSDAFLWVADAGVAFMGDLVQVGYHPFISQGDYREWLQTLERVEALPVELVVPGHGPVADGAAVGIMREYVLTLKELAQQVLESGGTPEAMAIPHRFRGWESPSLFTQNLAHMTSLLAPA